VADGVLSVGGLGLMTAAAYLGGHLIYICGVGVNHTAFEEAASTWTDVGALADLPTGKPVATAGGVPLVLVRQDDLVHALSATCVHAGGPLAERSLLNGSPRCPWHGSVFRLTDGKPRADPPLPGRCAMRRSGFRSAQPGPEPAARFGGWR
jgi:nitrite reductase/ring-hydroxylating ferredoxin subunit